MRLRYSALGAQCVLLLGVHFFFHAPFLLLPSLVPLAALGVANVALAAWLRAGRPLAPRGLLLHVLLDVAALTGLLAFTGGAMNPFTTLYLLYVGLASLMLPRAHSAAVLGATALAFGGLLFGRPEAIHVWHSGQMFVLHVRGMWLVFALTGGALWYFIHRLSDALRTREEELAQARLATERAHRVAALGHLAAGAAHELNTPLGTMAIAAAELSDLLGAQPEAKSHADLIRAQVRRCRELLSQLRSHEARPEAPLEVDLAEQAREVLARWTPRGSARVELRASGPARVRLWPERFAQALHCLLDNAARAQEHTGSREPLRVDVCVEGPRAQLRVRDRGEGFPREVAEHLGEPFVSTREPGQGMGLGLFLCSAMASQLGGELRLEAQSEGGACVLLELPLSAER